MEFSHNENEDLSTALRFAQDEKSDDGVSFKMKKVLVFSLRRKRLCALLKMKKGGGVPY